VDALVVILFAFVVYSRLDEVSVYLLFLEVFLEDALEIRGV
jgi:hypothetical protein